MIRLLFDSVKPVCLAGVLALMTLAPGAAAATASPAGACSITVPYKGLDNVHVKYDETGCTWDASVTRVELQRVQSSGVVIASGSVHSLAGQRNEALDASKSYSYSFYGYDASNNVYSPSEHPTAYVYFYTDYASVQGTPLFDEIIDNPHNYTHVWISVTVPAGRVFTIGDVAFDVGGTVAVSGTLQIAGPVTRTLGTTPEQSWLPGLPKFTFYAPQSLAFSRPGAILVFAAGSQGSSVSGARGTVFWVKQTGSVSFGAGQGNLFLLGTQASVDWTNEQDSEVATGCVGDGPAQGTLTIRDSKLMPLQDSGVKGGCPNPASFFRSFALGGSGKLDMQDSTFMDPRTWTNSWTFTGTAQAILSRVVISVPLNLSLPAGAGQTAFKAENTVFVGAVTLDGPGAFQNDEFDDNLTLVRPADVSVKYSVLAGQIALPAWSGSKVPTIRYNSFVGPTALTYSGANPVAIGPNYYGDKGGPGVAGADFMAARGAVVSAVPTTSLSLGQPDTSGSFPTSGRVFPKIWLINYIMGQNTIPHAGHGAGSPLIESRDTLLSLDVGVAAESLPRLQIYAVIGGTNQRIDAQPLVGCQI